jgi:hypothetical protein
MSPYYFLQYSKSTIPAMVKFQELRVYNKRLYNMSYLYGEVITS